MYSRFRCMLGRKGALRALVRASDLVSSSGRRPIHGQLISIEMPHLSAVTADDTCHIAVELIGNNKPATTLHEQGASDVSFGLLNQRDAQPSPDVAGSVAAIAERHWLGGPRDREMLNTAETGHLALASINTLDAEKIVERILGMFTRAEHASVPPEAIPCPSR